jgi:toxin ParE1/3/4
MTERIEAGSRRSRILRGAHVEMNHAADEYDEATPGLGDDFLATVETAFNAIVQAPQRWPRIDDRHQRYVLRRFPFSLIYRFSDAEVVLVAVAHQKRQPNYWARHR